MAALSRRFWQWYERHYVLNITLSTGLFVLQLFHLYWLTTDVVFVRLLGNSFFNPSLELEYIIIAVDYTEIPALIATSLVYLHVLSKHFRWKPVLYLLFLNIQWLHLFWITDEFVINVFEGGSMFPVWLAWVAILIDYLELPVIVDTVRRMITALRESDVWKTLAKAARYYIWRNP